MKANLPLFLCILKVIFVESSDNDGRDDENSADDSEFNASNAESLVKRFRPKDPFWKDPIDDVNGSFRDDPSNLQKLKYSEKKDKENDSNKMDEAEKRQYIAELKAGDMTRLFGTNQHRHQHENYRIYDLGRRFVPQYPYEEVNQNNLNQDDEDPSLIPKYAPPELVLAIAKESALIQAVQPIDPNEHLIKKDSLRTGNYWNSYWNEEVEDPTDALRSPNRNKLDTMTAKLSPGTAIYEYVSKLNKLYPKLLYVINKRK